MPNPKFVDKQTVDQVDDQQNHGHLPAHFKETASLVHNENAWQQDSQIHHRTELHEKRTPAYVLFGRQPELNAAFLNVLVIKMNHPDGAAAYTGRAGKNQQYAEQYTLKQ